MSSIATPVPAIFTLDTAGIITNKKQLMSKLMEYFQASHYSQTSYIPNDVSSLKYLIALHKDQGDQTDLTRAVESTLTKMYTRFFATATVNTSVTNNVTDTSTNKLSIDIIATDENNVTYTLSSIIEFTSGNITKFNILNDKLHGDNYNGNANS